MTNRDNNQVTIITAASNADGTTSVAIKADPTSHRLVMENGTSGSDLSGDDASRDVNSVPFMLAISSSDGVTPVPIYANPSTGAILIKRT